MIKVTIYVLFFLVVNPMYAEIYKWTDSQGVVHYSDEPHNGAETVTLPSIQTNTPSSSNAPPPPASPPESTSTNKSAAQQYSSVAITEPKSDTTIRNNEGYVPIIVTLEPDLKTGDTIQLKLDGKAVGTPQTGKIFSLNNVNRGTHTLVIDILDANGDILNTSDSVMFYMQRPRVGMVPNTRPAKAP